MNDVRGAQTLESMSQAVWYNKWTISKFKKYLKGDILEVGCGIGNFTQTLEKYGSVFGIDINLDYIKQTAKLAGKSTRVGFGDIEKGEYFFGSRKFDCIVCLNVLEHINNDSQALTNLYSLLKNDGYLILLAPLHPFLYGSIDEAIGHFRRYTKKHLLNLLKNAGFEILKCRILNFLGAIGWFITGKILKEKGVEETKIKFFNVVAPVVLSLEDLIEPQFGTSILIIAKKRP